MLYVKNRFGEDSEMTISLSENNVYNRCPSCGKEVSVNLSDIVTRDDTSIEDIMVLCDDCGQKVLKKMGF